MGSADKGKLLMIEREREREEGSWGGREGEEWGGRERETLSDCTDHCPWCLALPSYYSVFGPNSASGSQ